MARQIAKDAGFTLVEILVVLAILAITTSVVILSIPPTVMPIEKQANRLHLEINALAQDGLISGAVTAAGFSKDGYALYAFENSEWTQKASGEWQDNYRLTLTRVTTKLDIPKTTEPIILFQPTGLSTPFELTLSDRETRYALKTAGDGRVDLVKSTP